MPSAVLWRYDHTTEPWLRRLLLLGSAAVYGALGLLLASAAVVLLVTLVRGSTEFRLLVVVLALVGGPFSLLYLLPILRDPDQRPTFYPDGVEPSLGARERVAAGVAGAFVLAGAMVVEPTLAVGLFLGGGCAGLLALLCSTRGRIDPETATAESGPREWDLSRLVGYSVRRVGPIAVVSFDASGPGSFGTVPSRIAVPTTVLEEVTAALDAVVTENEERDGREPNPAVRAVAIAFAVLFAGGGVAAALFAGAVGWYAGAIGLLFAAVFLLVAREG